MSTAKPVQSHDAPSSGAVARVRQAWGSAWALGRRFDGTRSLLALLLGSLIAAAIVVADHLGGAWEAGAFLLALGALVLLLSGLRRLAVHLRMRLDAWSARVARQRAAQRIWAMAQRDARLMARLQAAGAGAPGAALWQDLPAA